MFKRYLVAIVLSVFLAACVTPSLDTANKRVLSAELAVQSMLEQVDQYRCDRERREAREPGCFTPGQWEDVYPRLRELSIAYQGLQVAKNRGEDVGANISTVNAALRALRPYVLEATADE